MASGQIYSLCTIISLSQNRLFNKLLFTLTLQKEWVTSQKYIQYLFGGLKGTVLEHQGNDTFMAEYCRESKYQDKIVVVLITRSYL